MVVRAGESGAPVPVNSISVASRGCGPWVRGELLLVTGTGLLQDAEHWPAYTAVTMAMAAPLPMEAVVDNC